MNDVPFWVDAPRTVKLNNGEDKVFIFSSRKALGEKIVEYVVGEARKMNKKSFTSTELLRAPWMPTQSVVLHGTWFKSLQELADRVNSAI